jgi:hypothetical protein
MSAGNGGAAGKAQGLARMLRQLSDSGCVGREVAEVLTAWEPKAQDLSRAFDSLEQVTKELDEIAARCFELGREAQRAAQRVQRARGVRCE